jgi:hypothetical protein
MKRELQKRIGKSLMKLIVKNKEQLRMLKIKCLMLKKLPKLLIKDEQKLSELMINNKKRTKQRKEKTKQQEKELIDNIKMDKKLLELQWMLPPKLKRILLMPLMLLDLLKLLTTENQTTPKTKLLKQTKMLWMKKIQIKNKTNHLRSL